MTNYAYEENAAAVATKFKMKLQQITEKNCRRMVLRNLWI